MTGRLPLSAAGKAEVQRLRDFVAAAVAASRWDLPVRARLRASWASPHLTARPALPAQNPRRDRRRGGGG